MADNDFFVRFDSNANEWAQSLAGELRPATAAIRQMYEAIERLDQTTAKSRGNLSRTLAAGADQEAPGYGKALLDLQTGNLQSALDAQEHDLKKLSGEVRDLAGSMHRAVSALADIPTQVSAAIQKLNRNTGQQVRQLEGRGPTQDPVTGRVTSGVGIQMGSTLAGVARILRLHEQATGQTFTGTTNRYQQAADAYTRTGRPQYVGSIAQSSIDKAGADRIVTAIRAQTRSIVGAISNIKLPPGSGGTSGGGPTPPAAPPPPPPTTSTGTSTPDVDDANAEARIRALQGQLAQLDEGRQAINQQLINLASQLEARGDDQSEGAQQLRAAIAQLKAQQEASGAIRSEMAAALREAEREATGVTRTQQSEAAKKKFKEEQAARPSITDVEIEDRLRKLGLIQQAAAGDFDIRAGKKAQNNDAISLEELHETRRAFESLGIAVEGVNAASRKSQLVPALQQAATRFQQQYPEGHPDLATTGFSKEITTRVGPRLAAMVGDIEPFAEAVANARRILRASTESGGERITPAGRRPTAWADQDPGVFGKNTPKIDIGSAVIQVPPNMIKGRATPGAAIGDAPGLFSRAQWEAAAQLVRLDPQRQMSRAVQLAGQDPTFNPYDPSLRGELKQGASDEERAKHEAVQTALRELREATIILDKMGTDYHNIKRMLEHKRRELGQLSSEADAILKSGGDPKAQANRIAELNQQIGHLDERLTRTAPRLRTLFESETYQQGWRQREGISVPFTMSAREIFQGRQNQTIARNFSPWGDLNAALGQALVGMRTTIGSRTQISPFPGLGFDKTRGFYSKDETVKRPIFDDEGKKVGEETIHEGLDPKVVKDLDKSRRDLVTAHAQYYRTINDADSSTEEVQQAMDRVQEKANILARRFDRVFGYSPTLASLADPTFTGLGPFDARGSRPGEARHVPITDPDILAEEADRQLRRDELRRRAETKFEATPEMKRERLDQQAARLQKDLLELQERRKTASARIAASEERFNQAYAQLTPTQQDEYDAHKQAAATAKARAAVLKKQLAALENISYVQRPDNDEAWDPIHMLGLERPKGFEQASPDELREHLQRQLLRETGAAVAATAAARNVGSETTVAGPKLAEEEIAALRKQVTQFKRQATLAEKKTAQMEQELQQSITRVDERGISRQLTQPERYRVDTLGYDASLGYAPSLQSDYEARQARVRAQEQEAIARRQAAIDAERQLATGSATQYETARVPSLAEGLNTKARQELDETEREIAQLVAEINRLQGEAGKLVPKLKETTTSTKGEEDALKQVTAAANGRIRELLEERRLLRAEGPYTRNERKQAYKAGDQALIAEINARRSALARIKNELDQLGYVRGSGSGGGGGGLPPTAQGGADAGDGEGRSLLTQILSTLKAIHATLKRGLKVTGIKVEKDGSTTATTTATPKPRTTAPPVAGGTSAADLNAARDLRRTQQLAGVQAETERLKNRNAERAAKDAAAAQEELAQKTAKTAEQQRAQARTEETLRRAMDGVSDETKQEIEQLRRLAAASTKARTEAEKLAAQQKIAAQQTKVATLMTRDLRGAVPYADDRRKLIGATLNDAGPRVNSAELTDVLRTVPSEAADNAGSYIGADMGEAAMDGFARTFGGRHGFWSRIMNTTGTFIIRNFAAGFVFGLTNVMQDILTQALEAEATFVRVADALEATNKEVGSLRSGLTAMSSQYGVQLNDTYTTAASLTGLFSNSRDLEEATKISTQLQIISNGALNAEEAVGVLASTMSAFNLTGVEGAAKIADVLTSIQNNLGVNVETTAEGIARISGLAEQMNITLEESGVFVAAIAKQTNQTGAAAGEQLQRMLGVLQTGRGRGAIQDIFGDASAVTQAIRDNDYGTGIVELMKAWNGLSDAQQRTLGTTIAGQRQIASFNALMNASAQNLRALTKAQNSQGEASERVEKILKNLQSRIRQLITSFQGLIDQLIQTGILNIVGVALVGITNALQLINTILGKINEVMEASPVLSFLRDAATLALGAVIAFKLLAAAGRGIGGAWRGMRIEQDRWLERVKEAQRIRGATGVPGATAVAGAGGVTGTGASTAAASSAAASPWRRGIILGSVTSIARWSGRDLERPMSKLRDSFNRTADNIRREGAKTGRSLAGFGSGLLRVSDDLRKRGGYNISDARQIRNLPTPQGSRLGVFAQQAYQRAVAAQMSATGRAMDAVGRSGQVAAVGANRAAAALGTLGRGLGNIGAKGLAADAALALVVSTIVLMANEAKRASESLRTARESIKATFYPEEAAAEDARLTPGSPEYVGDAYAQAKKDQEEFASRNDTFWGDVSESLKYTGSVFTDLDTYKGALLGPISGEGPTTALTPERYRQEAYGQDVNGDMTGWAEMERYYQQALNSLDALDTVEEINRAEDKFFKDLQAKSFQAAFRGYSDQEEASYLASIEYANYMIQKMLADKRAQLEGLLSGSALTGNEIEKLLGTLNSFSQYNDQGILGDPTIMEDLRRRIDDIGLSPLSETYKQLQELLGSYALRLQGDIKPHPGPTIRDVQLPDIEGTSAADLQRYNQLPTGVEIARANVLLTRDALENAANNLEQVGDDPDLVEEAQAKYDSAASAYAQALSSLSERLGSRADQTAELLTATGDYEGAMQAQINAVVKADRLFRNMNRDIIKAIRETRRILRRAQRRADQAAERYGPDDRRTLDLRGVEEGVRDDLRRLNRMLRRTDSWRAHASRQIARVHSIVQTAIVEATADLNLKIARASTDELRAALELQKAQIINRIMSQFNQGIVPDSVNLTPRQADAVQTWGDLAGNEEEVNQSRVDVINAQNAYDDAQEQAAEDAKAAAEEARQKAAERRQLRAEYRQAQLGIGAAFADARGDAVAAARIQVQVAQAMIAAARADLAAAVTYEETMQARIAILNAQAQLIGAHAAVQQAQDDLVQSQYEVSIALAEAAGRTVLVARRQLEAARAALRAALKQSHGKATADVNQARAEAIRAEAALRDAKLQDDLDTIDFNLQMGRITQSAAIHALQEILRTRELTRDQRRQLLLQIKGMKDEMADSQWNIGDIRLPTPYQMRRYIEERRNQFRNELNQAAGGTRPAGGTGAPVQSSSVTNQTTVQIDINGADIQQIRRVIREVVGGNVSLNRTTGARRGR
jgi:hypothetical protein